MQKSYIYETLYSRLFYHTRSLHREATTNGSSYAGIQAPKNDKSLDLISDS